jgi:hypothetical protein
LKTVVQPGDAGGRKQGRQSGKSSAPAACSLQSYAPAPCVRGRRRARHSLALLNQKYTELQGGQRAGRCQGRLFCHGTVAPPPLPMPLLHCCGPLPASAPLPRPHVGGGSAAPVSLFAIFTARRRNGGRARGDGRNRRRRPTGMP